jgi:hypothetical protein
MQRKITIACMVSVLLACGVHHLLGYSRTLAFFFQNAVADSMGTSVRIYLLRRCSNHEMFRKSDYADLRKNVFIDLKSHRNNLWINQVEWVGNEHKMWEIICVQHDQISANSPIVRGELVVIFDGAKVDFIDFTNQRAGYFLRPE